MARQSGLLARLVPMLLLGTALSGCGTLIDTFARGGPRVFGGTVFDVNFGGDLVGHEPLPTLLGLILLADAPLSLALDILLLPITLTRQWHRRTGKTDTGGARDLRPSSGIDRQGAFAAEREAEQPDWLRAGRFRRNRPFDAPPNVRIDLRRGR